INLIFKKWCGSACTLGIMPQQLATLATQTQNQTVSTLNAHRDTNWLYGFDAQTALMVPALKLAPNGNKVRIASFNGVSGNLSLIQRGDGKSGLVADVGLNGYWLGWGV